MKRLLKLLACLYPSNWHRRYGAEFEALLEDSTPRIRDLCDVFLGALKMQITTWNFTRITLAACLTGTLAAVAISFTIPPHYISQTLILVNPSEGLVSHDSIASTHSAMQSYLINLEPDVLNRTSLSGIIERLNLYPRERANMPLDAVITKMQSNIYVKPVEGTVGLSAFFVQFDYPDPYLAQKVNGELVSLLMSANLAYAQSHPHLVFRAMDEPELPQRPAGLNRIQVGAIGLLIGLPAGLILAAVVRLRRKPLVVSD